MSLTLFFFLSTSKEKKSVTVPSKLGNANLVVVLELVSLLNDAYASFLRKKFELGGEENPE